MVFVKRKFEHPSISENSSEVPASCQVGEGVLRVLRGEHPPREVGESRRLRYPHVMLVFFPLFHDA